MTSHDAYFEYLKSRRFTGALYRRLWLYPCLCRYLSGRVLDVGCGLGDMVAFRPNTIGVDINPKAVALCRARGLDVRLMQPDVLPFETAVFSGVVLDNVLEHMSAPKALLGEIRRVLVRRGNLLVGVPSKRGYQSDADHKIFYDEVALTEELQAAGFACTKLFHMPVRSRWLNRCMPQYCIYGVFSCV